MPFTYNPSPRRGLYAGPPAGGIRTEPWQPAVPPLKFAGPADEIANALPGLVSNAATYLRNQAGNAIGGFAFNPAAGFAFNPFASATPSPYAGVDQSHFVPGEPIYGGANGPYTVDNAGNVIPIVAPVTPVVKPYALGSSAANARVFPADQMANAKANADATVITNRTGNAYSLADVQNAAAQVAKYGVTPEQIIQLARSELNRGDSHINNFTPQSLAAQAAANNAWGDEARRVGILGVSPASDNLIWQQHWRFENGFSNSDPLFSGHPESVQRLQSIAEQMIKDQSIASWGSLTNYQEGQGTPTAAWQPQPVQPAAQPAGGGGNQGGGYAFNGAVGAVTGNIGTGGGTPLPTGVY